MATEPRVFKPGDRVRISIEGDRRTWHARVHLVNTEGEPIAVAGYDGIIEGFVGWLPILWIDGQPMTFQRTPLSIEAEGS